jgi:uncharacterized protein (TIGR02118 family)
MKLRSQRQAADARLSYASNPTEKMMTEIKQLTLLQRKEGLSQEEFQRYWRNVHAPLVRELPYVLSYTQHHVTASSPRSGYAAPQVAVDGVVEFVFESAEGARKAFEGPEGRAALDDAENFISAMLVLSVTSHPVIGPDEKS